MTVRGLPAPPESVQRREARHHEAVQPREPGQPSHARLRQLGAGLGIVLLTLAVALLVIVAVLPRVSGWHFVIVAGGSMEPTIPLGSVAVMQAVDDPGTLHAGDVIEYRSPETGQITTHRIVELGRGGASFVTQGDANNAADRAPVPAANLLGRYEFHVPWVGSALTSLRSPAGYVTLVMVPGCVLLYLEGRSLFRAWRLSRASRSARSSSTVDY